MFGEYLDTKIIRLISHNRNIKTEKELELELNEKPLHFDSSQFDKFIKRNKSNFDFKNKRILEVCCGEGNLANAIAKNGAKEVLAIDFQRKFIERAKKIAQSEKIENVTFIEADFLNYEVIGKFDYIITVAAFDHILNFKQTIEKIISCLDKNGRFIDFSTEFWGSPVSDHCNGWMKFFIPWRQFLFNRNAIFNVRKEKYRPTDEGTTWSTITGGLSQYYFNDYKNAIYNSNCEILKFDCNYQFKYIYNEKLSFLTKISNFIARIPLLSNYLISTAHVVLENKSR